LKVEIAASTNYFKVVMIKQYGTINNTQNNDKLVQNIDGFA